MKLALFLAVLITAVAADSVTDELEKNGLPVGLLPSSVTTYSIDKDGQFTLSLKAPCYAKIDDQVWNPCRFLFDQLNFVAVVMAVEIPLMRVCRGSYTSREYRVEDENKVCLGILGSILSNDEM